jgi:hypothetical protein
MGIDHVDALAHLTIIAHPSLTAVAPKPSATGVVMGPVPVRYIDTVSLRTAGPDALTTLQSPWRMAPSCVPGLSGVKMPGAVFATGLAINSSISAARLLGSAEATQGKHAVRIGNAPGQIQRDAPKIN